MRSWISFITSFIGSWNRLYKNNYLQSQIATITVACAVPSCYTSCLAARWSHLHINAKWQKLQSSWHLVANTLDSGKTLVLSMRVQIFILSGIWSVSHCGVSSTLNHFTQGGGGWLADDWTNTSGNVFNELQSSSLSPCLLNKFIEYWYRRGVTTRSLLNWRWTCTHKLLLFRKIWKSTVGDTVSEDCLYCIHYVIFIE